jgi:hypothetical protein
VEFRRPGTSAIYVERFLDGHIVVNAYPAAAVQVAEGISAVRARGGSE